MPGNGMRLQAMGERVDKVFIEGLEIQAQIGIYDWERQIRQPLVFDLELAFDNRKPAASDAIGDTLDYKAVSKRLIGFVSQSGFGLVETLAERCAAIVLDEFDVAHVRLKLSKPGAVRGARAVGVIIERSRTSRAHADDATGAQAGRVDVGRNPPEVVSPAAAVVAEAVAAAPVAAMAATRGVAVQPAPAAATPSIATVARLPASNRFKPRPARVSQLGSNIAPEKTCVPRSPPCARSSATWWCRRRTAPVRLASTVPSSSMRSR